MAPPDEAKGSKIEFRICIGLRGPINPGDYEVGEANINVSYPDWANISPLPPIRIPRGVSTLFVVSWKDKSGEIEKQLNSKSGERHHPVYVALEFISKFLRAFKLVRAGHADGLHIRTVGVADTLFYATTINDVPCGNLNMGMRLDHRDHPWVAGSREQPFDPHGTTKLALPHVNAEIFPIARKYVRCFELLEHGYYTETVVVAHSNLDDIVQEIVHHQLQSKGLNDEKTREDLLRAIKESRLSIYLGPLLKVLSGKSINEIWLDADSAIGWLNKTRNGIAHGGEQADYDDACKAVFVCIKVLAGLNKHGLVSAEFPAGMFRQARYHAAGTLNPPDWVPKSHELDSDPFD